MFTNFIFCGQTEHETHHSRHPCCHPCWQGSPRVCVVGNNCYTCPVHCLQTPDGNGLSNQRGMDPFQLSWDLVVNLLYLAVEASYPATNNIHTNISDYYVSFDMTITVVLQVDRNILGQHTVSTFILENAGRMLFQNINIHLQNYIMPQLRIPESEKLLLYWKFSIFLNYFQTQALKTEPVSIIMCKAGKVPSHMDQICCT